ncbi:hypothetical protein AYJ54_08285 [Bradyrhizobium centrolobii]|uniref:Uncharacterized protein n=1 Tax=Bradyrhizobium centrolobii TaxID=1505087 RepID=A0A176YYH4_9BRAD|nr:hypothetical protein AYJ54_08285 [Bradyrhizobium centrolobii]
MVPAEKPARHWRRRDIFGVAVRNTNPRRIRRYAKLVENVLPFDDPVARGTKKPLATRPAAKPGSKTDAG